MKILSHRGYWKTAAEKNQDVAFHRSFSLGFGTETDLRDHNGELVIFHDLPTGSELTSARSFFEIYSRYQGDMPLALNIKADGLQTPLAALLKQFNITNYFLFDMSIPDTLRSLKAGLTCYARTSEFEKPTERLLRDVSGIWYDYFEPAALNIDEIRGYLKLGKTVCLVSSELHGRDPKSLWNEIKFNGLDQLSNVLLCTDIPEDFAAFLKT